VSLLTDVTIVPRPITIEPAVLPITIEIVAGSTFGIPATAALIVTPLASELKEPEVKVDVATPESSVYTITGDIDSPPPVGFSIEKATGAPLTT